MDTENISTIETEVDELHELSFRIGALYRRRMEEDLDRFNLTAPQFVALRCIHSVQQGGKPLTLSDLAAAAHQHAPTMTGIVDRLEERGLVRRERSTLDRRSQHVTLTPAGEEILKEYQRIKREQVKLFLESLAVEERQVLLRLLRAYADSMGEVRRK
jgi:DNA-binding MarR family transcriptional regulator